MIEVVKNVVEKVFIFFIVGGGIRNLDDIRYLFLVGVDKVLINFAVVKNFDFVNEAVKVFGL